MIDNSTWWLLLGLLIVGIALFAMRIYNERERQRQVEAELDRQLMALRTKPKPVASKTDDLNSLLRQATKTDNPRAKTPSEQWRGTGNARRDTPHDGGINANHPLHPHNPHSPLNPVYQENLSDHAHSCSTRNHRHDPSPSHSSSDSYSYSSSSDSGSSSSSSSSSSCD